MTRKIILFSGPPCSGKSTLATTLAIKLKLPHLQMDRIRAAILPESKQDSKDRETAYRATHLAAEQLLQFDVSVILDATYRPDIQRRAVESLARRVNAGVYLVECKVQPEVALARFCNRPLDHPAVDLTPDRVRKLVDEFPYFGEGLTLDTSADNHDCVQKILDYIDHGSPIPLDGRWSSRALVSSVSQSPGTGNPTPQNAENSRTRPSRSDTDSQKRPIGMRLTSKSRRSARNSLLRIWVYWGWAVCMTIVGFAPVVLKMVAPNAPFLATHFSRRFPVLSWMVRPIVRATWDTLFTWGTFSLAAAAVGGALVPFMNRLHRLTRREVPISKAGNVPRYEPVSNRRPPDTLVYQEYHSRSSPTARAGFLVPNVPVYFIIPPRSPFRVRVVTGGTPIDEDTICAEAADEGLDWRGFKSWQRESKGEEYDRFIDESCIRCTDIKNLGDVLSLTITKCPFVEYVCSELAVNLDAGERFGNLRRFFEGPNFSSGSVNLEDLAEASRRYSMIVSATSLVTTLDGYVILQRRSKFVSEGAGGLSATGSGFARWGADFPWNARISIPFRRQTVIPDVIRNSALRELKEETGIRPSLLRKTENDFLGAAFNLLHGRDLNFYAHFWGNISVRDLEYLRREAKDRWEVASLVPVHLRFITEDGRLNGTVQALDAGCNRHLRAALYAFARSGRLREVKMEMDIS